MKNIFLFSVLLFSLVVIAGSCKKKKKEPEPTGPVPTATMSFDGVAKSLSAPLTTYYSGSSGYVQYTEASPANKYLKVAFPGYATSTYTYNVATQSGMIEVYYWENDQLWTATAGSVLVTIANGWITSSFENLTFYNTNTGNVTVNKGSISTKITYPL